MDDTTRDQAFMSALVTEHFVLQSQAASATSEGGTRTSLYLLSLSSGLVAMGFAAQASPHTFQVFAARVLPALFLIGCFTVVRLVDTSIANIMFLRRITRIRRYYAGLLPDADRYFPLSGDDEQDTLAMLGTRRSRVMLWFTLASMVGVVNAIVAGTSIAVLLDAGLKSQRRGFGCCRHHRDSRCRGPGRRLRAVPLHDSVPRMTVAATHSDR